MNQNPNNALFAGLAAALICVAVILLIVLAIYIFFCLTLQRTQTAVRPRNRLIPPGLVWLHLLHLAGVIPILGILVGIGASVWDLIMVLKLSGSLQREFKARRWRTANEGFGRPVGLVWSVGQLALVPIGLVFNLLGPRLGSPQASMVVGLVLLVLALTLFVVWIVYWVQMAQYGRRLREGGRGYAPGSIEEDYDDEYRRPRHDEEDYDRRDDDQPRRRPREGDDERGDHDDHRDRPRRDDY